MELDALDKLSAKGFDGYIVRKDLVRRFKGQYPVPTYVCEFLLGRYCASVDPTEIEDGLQIVSRQLSNRAVRAGEEELFKSRSREQGSVKIIDIIKGRLDAKTDSYLAELPSLSLNDARISSELVHEHERMLTGGFYAVGTAVTGAIARVLIGVSPAEQFELIRDQMEQSGNLPPEALETLDKVSSFLESSGGGLLFIIGFGFSLLLGAVFCTIGGLIGGAVFKKEPPAPAAPAAPAAEPPAVGGTD